MCDYRHYTPADRAIADCEYFWVRAHHARTQMIAAWAAVGLEYRGPAATVPMAAVRAAAVRAADEAGVAHRPVIRMVKATWPRRERQMVAQAARWAEADRAARRASA
jgi:hypothetical protein